MRRTRGTSAKPFASQLSLFSAADRDSRPEPVTATSTGPAPEVVRVAVVEGVVTDPPPVGVQKAPKPGPSGRVFMAPGGSEPAVVNDGPLDLPPAAEASAWPTSHLAVPIPDSCPDAEHASVNDLLQRAGAARVPKDASGSLPAGEESPTVAAPAPVACARVRDAAAKPPPGTGSADPLVTDSKHIINDYKSIVIGLKSIVSDEKYASTDHPGPVVNDSKKELREMTGEEPEEKGNVALPQGKKSMVSVEKLERLINRMKPGDRQPMRDAMRVIVHSKTDIDTFALQPLEETQRLIRQYVAEMRRDREGHADNDVLVPAAMHHAAKLARAMKRGFFRLSRQFPGEGFPDALAPAPKKEWVHPYYLDPTKPEPRLRRELDSWKPQLRGQEPGTGVGKPILAKVAGEYRTKLLQIVTFCQQAGVPIGLSFGIAFMTKPDCITLWLPLLQAHYSGNGHAPALAAVKRVAADLLGEDHPNVAAVAAVQRDASKEYQNKGLRAKEVEQMRDLTRPEAAADQLQVWDLPAVIAKSAERKRLRPADRDSRLSCALTSAILLCAPAFAPRHLAAVNLETDVRSPGNGREIRCIDQHGAESWVPLSPDVCDRIDCLRAFRKAKDRTSPWLFPARGNSGPQTRQVAMTALARCIHEALGQELAVVDLRDALLINMGDHGIDDDKVLADTVGLDPRTVRRRLGIALRAPVPPAANDEGDTPMPPMVDGAEDAA